MKQLAACLLLVFPIWSSPVLGQSQMYDGNMLHGELKDFRLGSAAGDRIVTASTGFGFILGVHDALNGQQNRGGCFRTSANVTAGQLADIVFQYLEKYPQVRHYSGARLVAVALENAFPCQ